MGFHVLRIYIDWFFVVFFMVLFFFFGFFLVFVVGLSYLFDPLSRNPKTTQTLDVHLYIEKNRPLSRDRCKA